ncbi:MAG: hypothetical protein AVDCRST_MAG57-2945, partial [uncultured Blastococcus sp.]
VHGGGAPVRGPADGDPRRPRRADHPGLRRPRPVVAAVPRRRRRARLRRRGHLERHPGGNRRDGPRAQPAPRTTGCSRSRQPRDTAPRGGRPRRRLARARPADRDGRVPARAGRPGPPHHVGVRRRSAHHDRAPRRDAPGDLRRSGGPQGRPVAGDLRGDAVARRLARPASGPPARRRPRGPDGPARARRPGVRHGFRRDRRRRSGAAAPGVQPPPVERPVGLRGLRGAAGL